MTMRPIRFLALAATALALTLPALAPVSAGGKQAAAKYGKPSGGAKMNVNKPAPGKGYNQPAARSGTGGTNRNQSANRSNRGGKNNVVAGNTVVVGRPPAGNGYYDNGNYHNRPDWDDDDDDFLEFVGKTAAITAGVSVVTAVIGSVSNEKPDDCQPVNAYGQSYLYCNGTYYQQVSQGYQVVAPPTG
jgi:hypothetical protein